MMWFDDLLPLDIDRFDERVVLAKLTKAELHHHLRLNVLDLQRDRLSLLSFDEFLERSNSIPGQPGFLFHLPFSGSTLLCALLDHANTVVVRDPALIDAIYLEGRAAAPSRIADIGEAALRWFARIDPNLPTIIRSAGYRPAIVENLASGPGLGRGAVFLYDNWPQFLTQVLKDPKRAADMVLLSQGLTALRAFPHSARDLAASSGAAFWLDTLSRIGDLISAGQPIRTLSTSDIFADPVAGALAVARNFGAQPDLPRLIDAGGELEQRHAKSGAFYNECTRRQEAKELAKRFEAEIQTLQPIMRASGADDLIERIAEASLSVDVLIAMNHSKRKARAKTAVSFYERDKSHQRGSRHQLPHLGKQLAALRPVSHALADPWYRCEIRPIDSAWNHAGITSAVGGFNPARHTCYVAKRSALAGWLSDPGAFDCPPDQRRHLATDVLRYAHDYIHSWCYRVIVELAPEMEPATPTDPASLDLQAFTLVLTEAVAVVATDYWYLSLAGLRKRCGTEFDLGPMTVHYREQLLPKYRRAQPGLTVRSPAFLPRIARLYAIGEFDGFSEQDLLQNRDLANWMVRELLISPRQRFVARNWLAHLAGLPMDNEAAKARFDDMLATYTPLIHALADRTWQKIRHGRQDFVRCKGDQGQWHVAHDRPLDCRYATLSQLTDRKIDWTGGGVECWSAYLDQALSYHVLPDDPHTRVEIAARVERIRAEIDQAELTALLADLPPVGGVDRAPLEMLFVN